MSDNRSIRNRIRALEKALRLLIKEAQVVEGFSVSWQPLSPGDILELVKATKVAVTALNEDKDIEATSRQLVAKE
jgi:hypothetical protein